MPKVQRKFYRYSNCFKEKVVQEISSGSSASSVCRKYDIGSCSTVHRWLVKYGRTELTNTVIRIKMRREDDKLKELEAENRRLKIALADATLAQDALSTLIDIVDEHYQTDVKKNFGQQLFPEAVRVTNKK
jgi:Transposase and inactivated derivatives